MTLVDVYKKFFADMDPTWAAYQHYLVATDFNELAASNLLLASIMANGSAPAREEQKTPAPTTMNPADVAKQLKVSPATVIGWIRSGQLKASNLAKGPRPRYVIQPEALAEFLKMRQPEMPTPQRRRSRAVSGKRY